MSDPTGFGPTVDVRVQYRRVREALLAVLRDLTDEQWVRGTAAAPWRVRDVVAHLLGNDVGRISRGRDGHPGPAFRDGETLPVFLDRINDEWVRATARASTDVLLALLATTSSDVLAYWDSLDLATLGAPVSWTGRGTAPVWLDCARELTEDWVHQQQIRDAVGIPGLVDATTVHTVLDTFLHAIPYTLERQGCRDGALTIEVLDAGTWSWDGIDGRFRRTETAAATVLTIDSDSLWRLCVRLIEPAEARRRATVEGDARLADAALQVLSIIR